MAETTPETPRLVTRTVCLLGFGNVGRRFCALVARKGDELAADHGLRVLFSAVGTGTHGSLLAPRGLTAQEVLGLALAGRGVTTGGRTTTGGDATTGGAATVAEPSSGGDAPTATWSFPDDAAAGVDLIAASGADILVEATPLDPHGGRAAIAHFEAGFAHGTFGGWPISRRPAAGASCSRAP